MLQTKRTLRWCKHVRCNWKYPEIIWVNICGLRILVVKELISRIYVLLIMGTSTKQIILTCYRTLEIIERYKRIDCCYTWVSTSMNLQEGMVLSFDYSMDYPILDLSWSEGIEVIRASISRLDRKYGELYEWSTFT